MNKHDRERGTLDPFPGTIEIGYGLRKAMLNFQEPASYLTDAVKAIEAIRSDVVNDARRRGLRANEHDLSQALQILWNAVHAQIQYRAHPGSADYARLNAVAESIGYAHKLLADVMRSYGFRDITLDDFAKIGVGGR